MAVLQANWYNNSSLFARAMEDTNKILGKVFGTPGRAKVLRFFMQHSKAAYSINEISQRTGVPAPIISREVAALRTTGILRKKTISVRSAPKRKAKKVTAWFINEQFPYRVALEKFFTDTLLLDEAAIVKTILRIGRVKYVALSGIFVGLPEARIDILVVSDLAVQSALSRAIRKIETHICKEIRLAYLSTSDFNYRRNVNDKLLRDVFDYEHKIAIDRLPGAQNSL